MAIRRLSRAGALEQTVFDLQQHLADAEVMNVKKLGKREAKGRGLVSVIAAVMERGLQVLICLDKLWSSALEGEPEISGFSAIRDNP